VCGGLISPLCNNCWQAANSQLPRRALAVINGYPVIVIERLRLAVSNERLLLLLFLITPGLHAFIVLCVLLTINETSFGRARYYGRLSEDGSSIYNAIYFCFGGGFDDS
jgi:hypothetical protein